MVMPCICCCEVERTGVPSCVEDPTGCLSVGYKAILYEKGEVVLVVPFLHVHIGLDVTKTARSGSIIVSVLRL